MKIDNDLTTRRGGKYHVSRGETELYGFGSFHEAYRHALNLFGWEDFQVWHEEWGENPEGEANK